MARKDPHNFRLSLFPEQLFIKHKTIFFLQKLPHSGAFQLNLRKDFYYQDFSGRNIWLLLER